MLRLQVQGLEAESRAVESRLEADELVWRLALITRALGLTDPRLSG